MPVPIRVVTFLDRASYCSAPDLLRGALCPHPGTGCPDSNMWGDQPAYLTNSLLRTPMCRTQPCFLASGCSTHYKYALRAPWVENPTVHGASPPSRRNSVRHAGWRCWQLEDCGWLVNGWAGKRPSRRPDAVTVGFGVGGRGMFHLKWSVLGLFLAVGRAHRSETATGRSRPILRGTEL